MTEAKRATAKQHERFERLLAEESYREAGNTALASGDLELIGRALNATQPVSDSAQGWIIKLLAFVPDDFEPATPWRESIRWAATGVDTNWISRLPNVERLTISMGRAADGETALGLETLNQRLPSLRQLTIQGLRVGTSLSESGLRVDEVSLRNIKDAEVPSLAGMGVESVQIHACDNLITFGRPIGWESVRDVSIRHSRKLESIVGLAGLEKLESFDVQGYTSLKRLTPLVRAAKSGAPLRAVTLYNAGPVTTIGDLAGVETLEALILPASNIADVKTVSPKMKRLDLSGSGVTSLDILADCPELEDLVLTGCKALVDISALAGAKKLRRIDLRQCPKIEAAGVLAELSALACAGLEGTPTHPDEFSSELRVKCTWAREPEWEIAMRRGEPLTPRQPS